MRSLSLLGLIVALAVVGLLLKRQSMVIKVSAPPATVDVDTAPGQPDAVGKFKDALDEALQQGAQRLERLDADTN